MKMNKDNQRNKVLLELKKQRTYKLLRKSKWLHLDSNGVLNNL